MIEQPSPRPPPPSLTTTTTPPPPTSTQKHHRGTFWSSRGATDRIVETEEHGCTSPPPLARHTGALSLPSGLLGLATATWRPSLQPSYRAAHRGFLPRTPPPHCCDLGRGPPVCQSTPVGSPANTLTITPDRCLGPLCLRRAVFVINQTQLYTDDGYSHTIK